MEAICVAAAPPFPPGSIPAFTTDPDDDPIVYGALLAGADYLVSDDRDIAPHREPREYEHDDRRLLAVPFNYLVSELMPDVDWGDIHGGLLALAFAPISSRARSARRQRVTSRAAARRSAGRSQVNSASPWEKRRIQVCSPWPNPGNKRGTK